MRYSIIIPTFNRQQMTSSLIEQLLKENIPDSEILVIDDRSYDDTAENIARKYTDVKVLVNDRRRFVAHSRNRGIRESRGETLVFIDSDISFEEGMLGSFLSDLNPGFNFPVTKWEDGTEMPKGTSSIFALQRYLLARFNDDYFDENIGIYSDDTDFFTKAKIFGVDFAHKDKYIFTHHKKPNASKKYNYSDFEYYMGYKNNLYIAIKFAGLAKGYTFLRPFARLIKDIGLILANIATLRFKRAYLLLKAIGWNMLNIRACLLSRKKIAEKIVLQRQL